MGIIQAEPVGLLGFGSGPKMHAIQEIERYYNKISNLLNLAVQYVRTNEGITHPHKIALRIAELFTIGRMQPISAYYEIKGTLEDAVKRNYMGKVANSLYKGRTPTYTGRQALFYPIGTFNRYGKTLEAYVTIDRQNFPHIMYIIDDIESQGYTLDGLSGCNCSFGFTDDESGHDESDFGGLGFLPLLAAGLLLGRLLK
jgi:hypothetical protein